ncbi:MAG: phosphotransferase [Defluviitaleaceae bacterium]|nr:phosphotransferase [Defluviitaleaceae bacterium]
MDSIARNALQFYPIECKSIDFVRQNWNAVYKVVDNKNAVYCLRLHQSINPILGEEWMGKSAINSEMEWMYVLSTETDVVVPSPYKNNNDEFVTVTDGINCTLVKWLDGEHINRAYTKTDAILLGNMVGKLHKQSSQWTIPNHFSRPSYDEVSIMKSLKTLEKSELMLNKDSKTIFRTAAMKVYDFLNSLQKTNETWGMIHTDIVNENILFHNNEMYLLDFGCCGFGSFLWDVAVAIPSEMDIKYEFLTAYDFHYPLPSNYEGLIESFYVSMYIAYFDFFLTQPGAIDWVPKLLDDLANNEFNKYLNDKRFLFTT